MLLLAIILFGMVIGARAGAILLTAGWRWWEGRNKPTAADRAAKRSGDPRKANPR